MKNRQHKLVPSLIKEAIDPYEFYLREQNLSGFGYRSGKWAVAGLCPFHDDKKSGSFQVNLTSGGFKCWSCNESGGDIIAFIIKRDHVSFLNALEYIAQSGGLR